MRCARSSPSTSAAWARASRTSTTSWCSATASRTRRARSRTSTWTASARRRWRRCPTSSSTWSRSRGRPTTCARGWRSTARPGSAPWASRRWPGTATGASSSCGSSRSWPTPDRPLRLLLGAFGDPGHAFPLIALGGTLAARGHEVVLQTWKRWEDDVRAAGMRFEPAPEYHVFPTLERPLKPYEAVVRATGQTRPLVASLRPDVVVADILTLAPALAGELEGVPVATVIPHTDPRMAPGWPPYSVGARLPRTAVGRRLWGATARLTDAGLEHGRRELNETRRRL